MKDARLFPICAEKPILSTDEINKVAELLTGISPQKNEKNSTNKSAEQKNNRDLDAGYTYFGQFIAHDIVPCSDPEQSEYNYITSPALDLKSLYGEPAQYSMLFDKSGKFRISTERPYDVIRDESGRAIIPDQRNDENAIILQFHVLWQKIHNHIICDLTPDMPGQYNIDSISIHQQARQITTALFQFLTIYDFAARILHPDVFTCYFGEPPLNSAEVDFENIKINTKEYLLNCHTQFDAIPLEFSHAVFRFGHSMVLNNYKFDTEGKFKKSLKEIFRGKTKGNLSKDFRIRDWLAFFGDNSDSLKTQSANNIDLSISADMGGIPIAKHIVELNLTAGEKARLPSGYWLKDWILFSHPILAMDSGLAQSPQLIEDTDSNLKAYYDLVGKHYANASTSPTRKGDLPLWLYTLEEARLSPPYRRKLGHVSSIIVAEVLRQSVLSQQLTTSTSASYSELLQNMINRSFPVWSKWKHLKHKTMYSLIELFELREDKKNDIS